MKITERRVIRQEWYETETTKTGWDSHGWTFDNGDQIDDSWTIISFIVLDKHHNPLVGIAERDVNV